MRLFIAVISLSFILAARPLTFERRSSDLYRSGSVVVKPQSLSLGDVTMRFLGASASTRLEALGTPSPATYVGSAGKQTFAQFPKVAMRQLYRGVDGVFYGNGENLEYDLVAAPGADLRHIRIRFEGAREVRIDGDGNVHAGILTQRRPHVVQSDGRPVAVQYVLLGRNEIGIRVGPYNPRLGLTIDPEIVFTRTFGGSGTNTANAIATDAQGNIYIAGTTNSVDFPSARGGAPLATIGGDGVTVTQLPVGVEASVLAIAGTPDGRVLYAISPGSTYVSSDHGATWSQRGSLPVQPQNGNQQIAINAISVDAIDPSRVFVATNNGLLASFDGGRTWGMQAPGRYTGIIVSPMDHLVMYAATSQPNAVLKTINAGAMWSALTPTYANMPPGSGYTPYLLALGPNGSDLYVMDTFGVLLRSTDGGATWQRLAGAVQIFYSPRSIVFDPMNPSNIYVLDATGIWKSGDNGATFGLLVPTGTSTTLTNLALDAASQTLYFSNNNTVSSVSTNGGTPAAVPLATQFVHSLASFGGQVYAAYDVVPMSFVIKWDPTGTNVLYSIFFGAQQNIVNSLAVDPQGSAIVAGYRFGSISGSPPSGFVSRISADGANVMYSVSLSAQVQALALDSAGAAYATGQTPLAGFQSSSGAFESAPPMSSCNRPQGTIFVNPSLNVHAFVSKISPDGKIVYSTLVTGSCGSAATSIAVNGAGEAIVAGYTTSSDFPVTVGSYQAAFPGNPASTTPPSALTAGFAARLSAGGDKLLAGTYLGGSYLTTTSGVALDADGNVVLAGTTGKILPGATPGAYQQQAVDRCVIPIGIGPTPPYGGATDAFVLKLDPALSAPVYMTYLGGGCSDSANGIALDSSGNAWVIGFAGSSDFPLKMPFQGGGLTGRFLSEISADGSRLLFSSGTNGSALAIDPRGGVHVVGFTTTQVEWSKIGPSPVLPVVIDNVQAVNPYTPAILAPSSLGTGAAAGQLLRISGSSLGPTARVDATADAIGRMPFTLAGTTVRFDGIPAALVSVQEGAVVCFAPFEINGTTVVTVTAGGQTSNAVKLGVPLVDPHILSVSNQDGSINSQDHPAHVGEVLVLYVSGLGETSPLAVDGLINSGRPAKPASPVTVYLGGPVQPDFVGGAPGQIAGIMQVNVRIPPSSSGSLPTAVSIGSATAPVYMAQ